MAETVQVVWLASPLDERTLVLEERERDMVYGRLVQRLRAHGLQHFSDHLDLVEASPDTEAQGFTNALTTNPTSFFREQYQFGALAEQLVEAHHNSHGDTDQKLLIWCRAESTGEEPYSLAITACEAFATITPPVRTTYRAAATHGHR